MLSLIGLLKEQELSLSLKQFHHLLLIRIQKEYMCLLSVSQVMN
jgi:hypothetical protein